MTANKLNTTAYSKGQKVRILDRRYHVEVEAHLPERFSLSVGSDITSPFATYATEGPAAKALALMTGVSNKIGITTTKLFMGPDQPDISLDLKFEAYYSALNEVLLPTFNLMMMSVGTEEDFGEEAEKLVEFIRNMGELEDAVLNFILKDKSKAKDAGELIRYMRTPGTCRVILGDTFTLDNVYLSNVNVTYSNVLDSNFIPMSAEANITITPQNPFSKNTLVRSFFGNRGTVPKQRQNDLRSIYE